MSNRSAFLTTIAISELGKDLLERSDNGYNVIVGSTVQSPHLFFSYADHPRIRVWLPRLNIFSTAAGRYQLLERYFDDYKESLRLPDFGKSSQDMVALQQISECHALQDVDAGNFDDALNKCGRIWASLPSSRYGQHQNSVDFLKSTFLACGGCLAPVA